MTNLAVLGDECKGNIQKGYIVMGDPLILSNGIPVSRINDIVLVWGQTDVPPIGGELVAVPIAFTPLGQPIRWFIMEEGNIVRGCTTTKSASGQFLAIQDADWVSPHFKGTLIATSIHTAA